jgi:CBS domain-containing protein/Zn-dependent protease
MRVFHFAIPLYKTRLGFHISWYLAIALIIAVVVTRFPEYYPFTERLLLGLGASILFFLAMICRQLAINITSYYRHIPLSRVMLYPFGGVPMVAKEESMPILDVLLAVVGLLSSLIIVVIFYLGYLALVVTGNVWLAWLIQWLNYLTLMLFLVHFIPGFPLDGGRILRAVLWKTTRSYDRATLIAIRIGRVAGAAFFAGGVALLVNRQWFVGLIIAFLGWILYLAASSCKRSLLQTRSLQGMKVQQIMSQDFTIIPRQLTLSKLVQDFVITKGHSQFVVYDEDKLYGILNIEDMKAVPRKNWDKTTINQVMIPSSKQTTAYVDQSASDVLDRMNVYRISLIPVLDENRVVGLAVRDAMLRFNKTRSKLKI